MKVKFFCMECKVDVETNFTEEKVYQLKCVNGHEFKAFLQKEKFEILFQIGINAIEDGYFREAISSFAASLERFHEYYIKIVYSHRGLSVVTPWKEVSRYSERQLGAFIFLYFIENGQNPTLLNPNTDVPFRNNVIHKGVIPTKEKTIEFGQKVIDIIYPICVEMQKMYKAEMDIQVSNNRLESYEKDYSYIWQSLTLVTLNENEEKPNLKLHLSQEREKEEATTTVKLP